MTRDEALVAETARVTCEEVANERDDLFRHPCGCLAPWIGPNTVGEVLIPCDECLNDVGGLGPNDVFPDFDLPF